MASTAEQRGRNKKIARGMVDEELSFTHLVLNQDSILVEDIEGRKEGKLISLTTDQALKYQIADGTAENINSVLDSLDYKNFQIVEKGENWSEDIVRFLTNPVVASLLTTFGFLGILFELQSPGWGIPGFVGLTCLILSLSASYIAQLATMSDLLFVFAGLGTILLRNFGYSWVWHYWDFWFWIVDVRALFITFTRYSSWRRNSRTGYGWLFYRSGWVRYWIGFIS